MSFSRRRLCFALIAVLAAWANSSAVAQLPFFSGAEGYGGTFSGSPPAGGWFSNGTNYPVYHVTTTADTIDPSTGKPAVGTLRGAFYDYTQPNSPKQMASNRIVVFDVGGTFQLTQGSLDIKTVNNIYIAGQTAPTPVTVYGNTAQITKSGDTMTSNVILRYMTFRKGTGDGQDSITFAGGSGDGDTIATNMILDHVSASWSEDEILSVANNNSNVTVQYTLIHDALVSGHAYGSLIRPKVDSNVTFHHNMYAHNASRQARFGSYYYFDPDDPANDHSTTLTADFRNNVVYNWRDRASYAGGSSFGDGPEFADVNFVGNYFIAGPGTGGNTTKTFYVDQNITARVYQSGNFVDSDQQLNPGGQPNGSDTGWNMFQPNGGTLIQMATPFATAPVTTQSANDAYWQLIDHVGNWWWSRDAIDSRVIGNVLNNTNTPGGIGAAAPPAGELNSVLNTPTSTHPAGWDTDGDGMPNWWETTHGLNPNSASDWSADFDSDGYINLIEFINEAGEFPAPAPIVFNGATNNRYAVITNWKTSDGITAGSNWQPSKYDEAQINSGTVVVDAAGQHAGLLMIGATAGSATLNITGGWLDVEEAVMVGAHPSAQGTLSLSGGVLSTPYLGAGSADDLFSFTGGVLHADTIEFDVVVNNGGTLAPGNSIGETHVVGSLQLAAGSLEIELASPTASDMLLVDDLVTLGGNLSIATLGGFMPNEGDSWQIITAGSMTGTFGSITPGYSVEQQGSNLILYFGEPPGLEGDFNDDGVVDAADYVVWRRSGGSQAEYEAWLANFGAVAGGGNASAGGVPEPTTVGVMVLGCLLGLLDWRRRRR